MSLPVLVTGGLGYLGGRLGQHLAQADFEVRLGTRSPSGAPSLGFAARVQDVARASPGEYLQGVHCVVHLAAMNEIDSVQDPVGALMTNAVDTLRLLLACSKAGVRRFIYFSTAHVYGDALVGSVDERTLPQPVHPYAISHHAAEDYVLAAHRRGELDGVVVRLSNGYGAPAWSSVRRWTLVVNDLCRQAVEQRRLVLKSSGAQRRDFVPLGDVARATEHLIRLPREKLGDGLFNLGGDASWSILEMAQRVAARCRTVLGYEVPVERPAAAPEAAAAPLVFSTAKLKATGFSLAEHPDTEIDATLRACAAWFGR
jgi:UDP-glucose 4-epimerase